MFTTASELRRLLKTCLTNSLVLPKYLLTVAIEGNLADWVFDKFGWELEIVLYDKHIIMQSRRQSYIDFQDVNHITSRFNFA